ncbi:MAG: murein biosynthesis integral membrane protein MurJ [Pseudomonadota bacterium]
MTRAPSRMIAAMGSVGGWTLVSRIAGFVREIIFAALFGSSATAEAFQIAFSLPNMFRRFFAEGALSTAYVPMYSKKLAQAEMADDFASDAFSALAGFLIVFSALASLAMPALVWAMASGFVGDGRFDLAVDFGRVCFPYILFISLAALISGTLNAHGRFAVAAAAPVLLNIVLIAAMWFGPKFGFAAEWALTWGVPIAGILQLALVWHALKRAGIPLRLGWPRWTEDLKSLAIIAAPAALAGGVVQINLLVGRQVASQFEGAIQWLAVADRLYQLPLGVVGIAIGIVLLPTLSKALADDDKTTGSAAFNDAFILAFLLTAPAAIALICIPTPIVEALFERGAFTSEDTAKTATALAIYGLGLPAFVMQKLYQPIFFSRGDTKTPFRFALVAMVVNAVLAVGLMSALGYLAAAWATSISAYVMLALLIWKARQTGSESRFSRDTIMSISTTVAGCGVLALLFLPLSIAAEHFELNKYAELGLYVLAGGAVFAVLAGLPFNRRLLGR